VDPIRDGANWFAYVNNDPVNWVDHWGLSVIDNNINNERSLQVGQEMDGQNIVDTMLGAELNIVLSVQEIGNIIFNETRSLSGDSIQSARENIAHAIINASERWGENRSIYAGTASTTVADTAIIIDAEQYESSQNAAQTAYDTHLASDPTNGATNFNFRSNADRSNFLGTLGIQTQVGPLNNSYPTNTLPATGIYANTYR
jgi:hypothetical protein